MHKIYWDEVLLDNKEYLLLSKGRKIFIQNKNGKSITVLLPFRPLDILNFFRIFRRLFRTNKLNCLQIDKETCVLIRSYEIFSLHLVSGKVEKIVKLENTRNVMANSLNKFGQTGVMFGDYFANNSNKSVKIFYTDDLARKHFNSKEILSIVPCRHVHNVQHIEQLGSIFVSTGDFDGECWLLEFDEFFELKEIHGDGSQSFRTCSVVYENGYLYWGMDSPLADSFFIKYDCHMKKIISKKRLLGPCWYMIKRSDNIVLSTANEPSDLDPQISVVIYDINNDTFSSIKTYKKDFFPYLFKFGTITIRPSSDEAEYWLCFEAVAKLDGTIQRFRVNEQAIL